MTPENELEPREAAAREERNSKILKAAEALKIPGRGIQSQIEFKPSIMKRQIFKEKEDGRPDGWEIPGDKEVVGDQPVIKESISYKRQKKEETDKWENTDQIEKISHHFFHYDEQGHKILEEGMDLNVRNAWENKFEYNENGEVVSIKGRTTEGEKIGEEWENTTSVETRGDFTKKIRINSGKHFVNGELVPFKTVKVNYAGPDGKDFLYRSREYDAEGNELPDKNMDWQAEGSLPPDFQEW